MIDTHLPGPVAYVQTAMRRLVALDALTVLRCLLFIGALLLIWLTFSPFPDLRDPDLGSLDSGQLAKTYIVFGLLGLLALLLAAVEHMRAIKSLWTPLHICFVMWLAFNVVMSHTPGISLQRLILTASVTAVAAMMPLLMSTQRQFNACFATAAIVLLALCYLGLMLAPNLSMHTAADTVEPHLAGDWRGAFGHKNTAAPVMVVLIYLGFYLLSCGSLLMGAAVLVPAGIFLMNSGGKSALALCGVVWVLARLVRATRSLWLKMVIALTPVVLLNVVSVGSAVNPVLANLVRMLPIDPTFTGRTDIWQYAIEGFQRSPIVGYGYAAFWDNPENRVTPDMAAWAFNASHSHNGYLEMALTIGTPGLLLVLLIFVVAPLRNFHAIQQRGSDHKLANFFLVVWLFGVYLSSMETFLLDRRNAIWFTFVIAVAGLHYLSRFNVRTR